MFERPSLMSIKITTQACSPISIYLKKLAHNKRFQQYLTTLRELGINKSENKMKRSTKVLKLKEIECFLRMHFTLPR